jgi:hypothetical protein
MQISGAIVQGRAILGANKVQFDQAAEQMQACFSPKIEIYK